MVLKNGASYKKIIKYVLFFLSKKITFGILEEKN